MLGGYVNVCLGTGGAEQHQSSFHLIVWLIMNESSPNSIVEILPLSGDSEELSKAVLHDDK